MSTKTKTERFNDRTRFNWGFHDATLDAAEGWPDRTQIVDAKGLRRPLPADDAAYCEGYRRGLASYAKLGRREESSEAAWNEFMR